MMADIVEKTETPLPVTNLDDETDSLAKGADNPLVDPTPQNEVQQYQFNSPTGGGLVVEDGHVANQGYSPALLLESSLLNESAIDSFVQPGEGLKATVPQLESTRISSAYPPPEFELEQDISKVPSEQGDVDSPFNAGFIKPEQNSGLDSGVTESILTNSQKKEGESVLDSSVFESESGNQQLEMESSPANCETHALEESHDGSVPQDQNKELKDDNILEKDAQETGEHNGYATQDVPSSAARDEDKMLNDSDEQIEGNTTTPSVNRENPSLKRLSPPAELDTSAALSEPTSHPPNFENNPSDASASLQEILENFQDQEVSLLETVTRESAGSDSEVEQLMKLPETVTEFVSREGVKVFLVGTAHFSLESQEDVAKTILMTRPRVVMVELCVSRLNILRFDEQTILEEAQNLNMAKIRSTLKQYGAVQGALYLLFLSTSAHLTRQLGMAPGGEFRRAYNEARNVPGCRIHLGDRPIHITLHRALAALSLWQKAKLVWHLLLNRSSISPEEVEHCKKKDLLEEMLEEMTGEFPALSRVFVQERDLCLAHSLQLAAADAAAEARSNKFSEAPSVVGVVGIGHVAGIVSYFGSVTEADVRNVMKIPPRTRASRLLVTATKLTVVGLVAYGCYKCMPKMHNGLQSLRHMVFPH